MKAFCPDKARQQSGALAAVNRASRKGKGAVKRNKDNHTHCNPYVQDVFKASEAREIALEYRNFIIKKCQLKFAAVLNSIFWWFCPDFITAWFIHQTIHKREIIFHLIPIVNNNPDKKHFWFLFNISCRKSKLSFKWPQESLFTLKLNKTSFNVLKRQILALCDTYLGSNTAKKAPKEL